MDVRNIHGALTRVEPAAFWCKGQRSNQWSHPAGQELVKCKKITPV